MVKVGKYTIHESYGLYAIAITGKVIPLYDPKLSHFHCWSITASFPGYHQPFALRRSPTTQRPIAKPAAWSRMLHRCTQLKNMSRMTLDCPLTLEHPAIPKLSNWSHKKEAQKWPKKAWCLIGTFWRSSHDILSVSAGCPQFWFSSNSNGDFLWWWIL